MKEHHIKILEINSQKLKKKIRSPNFKDKSIKIS